MIIVLLVKCFYEIIWYGRIFFCLFHCLLFLDDNMRLNENNDASQHIKNDDVENLDNANFNA